MHEIPLAHRCGRTIWVRRAAAVLAAGLLVASGALTAAAGPAMAASAPRAASHSAGFSVTSSVAGHRPKPALARVLPTRHTFVPKPRSARRIVHPDVPITVSLAGPSSVYSTQTATLTATASIDVGPTPYFIRIYDNSTGTYVATCGNGSTCTANVTLSVGEDTAQSFIAYVGDASNSLPPGNLQAKSNGIFVNWLAIDISSFTSNVSTLPVGGTATLTATTTRDVGPSPFWTEIYDTTTGTVAGECGFGTSCSVNVSQSVATTHTYVAYVSAFSTAFPPSEILSQSADTLYVTWTGTGYQLSLTGPAFAEGPATYTATANVDVGPTPYFIEIFSEIPGSAPLAVCGTGTTCSAKLTPSGGTSHFIAFICSYSAAFPPSGIQASSNVLDSTFILP